jgi:hypothetical protein
VKEAFALSPTLSEHTRSTQQFVSMFDLFFDCLNVRRLGQDERLRKPALAPYRHGDDWRFQVRFSFAFESNISTSHET